MRQLFARRPSSLEALRLLLIPLCVFVVILVTSNAFNVVTDTVNDFLYPASDSCENTENSTSNSPDDLFRATLFTRGCGATTNEMTFVTIRSINQPLDLETVWTHRFFSTIEPDIVFESDEELNLQIAWSSSRVLRIKNVGRVQIDEQKVLRSKSQWNDVQIVLP